MNDIKIKGGIKGWKRIMNPSEKNNIQNKNDSPQALRDKEERELTK